MTTLLQAVETLSGVERQLADIYALLLEKWKRQRLTPTDVQVYDRLRFKLYSAEMECYGRYALQGQRVARAVGADWVAAQIPLPKCARALPFAVNDPKFVGLRGLGAAPLLAVPAISLTGWALILLGTAAAVLLILGAMVVTATLTYYLASLVDDYGQALDYYSTVERVAQDCLASGRTTAECAGLVAGIPPPKGQPPTDPKTMMLMGGIAVGIGLLVLFGLANRGGGSGGGTIVLRGS